MNTPPHHPKRKIRILAATLAWAGLLQAHADLPAIYNSEPESSGSPMPAELAAARFQTPPDFRVSLVAAEPDVRNPIAMAWDGRGRLWIAENYTYAERARRFDLGQRDQVLIFEPSPSGGKFRSRRVFTDQVQMLTSIEPTPDGVWLLCPPQLLFIPDSNHDDVPDGPAEVLLDGFNPPAENYHNFANGLKFGPDGWLYGRCGASSPGDIGRPGTPPEQRIPLRGTVWRYHPQRRVFEALSSGTTNPWGHDWDEFGELLFINTVNGHLWHGIAGAHYVRPHTLDPNPRAYELIDMHADHWHFDTAAGWTKSRDGAANDYGGGHAHIGMMIYQGDNWPASYRGRLFTWNMHGRRLNQEILERRGSGYVAHHGPDVFRATDTWFRGMDLSTGPDGTVFAIDWSDAGECHDSTGVHRTSGRIFNLAHGTPSGAAPTPMAVAGIRELIDLQRHPNAWHARQARLEITARKARGTSFETLLEPLMTEVRREPNAAHAVRLLWTWNAAGGIDPRQLLPLLQHPDEHLRAWTIRLLSDRWPLDTVMSQRPPQAAKSPPPAPEVLAAFETRARTDTSGLVRLALASTLQRLPVRQRAPLASALMGRTEDAEDHNIPALVWYGLIPLAEVDPSALASMADTCVLPLTRRCLTRRLTEDAESHPAALDLALRNAAKHAGSTPVDMLEGLAQGLAGWRRAPQPASWRQFARRFEGSAAPRVQALVRELDIVFGDGRALAELERLALDPQAELPARSAALKTLAASGSATLRPVYEKLINVRFLNLPAARGLAQFEDTNAAQALARSYGSVHPSERPAWMEVLVSRPRFAEALLERIEQGSIPRTEITAFHARQIRGFQNPRLNELLHRVWGEWREPRADKRALIEELRKRLTPSTLAGANLSNGRSLFTSACAGCHRLHGEGVDLGPDLTGSGRSNLDYVLENVVDPSAVVTADFRLHTFELKDGRTFNGLVRGRTDRTLTVRTPSESFTIEKGEIRRDDVSAVSLMPEGLMESLSAEHQRDLVAYLQHPGQVPLPNSPASPPPRP